MLLIGLFEPCTIHWGMDGWQLPQDTETQDTGLGLYVAELDTKTLRNGQHIDFTFQRRPTGEWLGRNYVVAVTTGEPIA